MKDTLLVNLSDRRVKTELLTQIGRLQGLHEILIRPRQYTRSTNQNSYYWVAIVAPFTEWLREQYGDNGIDKEQAHEMLKVKILGLEEKQIGDEVLHLIPRSKTLTVEQFGEYIEKCSAWLADFANIIVIPPETYYGEDTLGKKK